ncbi:MW1434 family type I TA system toxin [Xenorhabdus sp. KJ12.1]|uniref:Thoeris anti-defense Tad2 family protein n=1 Tax=Xenorhabdus sp. KJ12.1 TaxID=1851571 RepID=UPI000C056E26|nr:MW1434 family type I TA system toxin [Xenorhabdus sp. KJ12.1]PHM68681.1 hypothetical protein Xekj_03064 [Xenorhabdus sp. KJ12.1]
MSDVNRLDDSNKCSFTPDQFNTKVDNVAPVGSFPWAMIQVYLGSNVRRNVWDTNTYIYGNKIGTSDQAINQANKEGVFAWNPEQQDMLACDWGLKLNSVCMLSFDLEIGTSKYDNRKSQDWGYLTKGGHLASDESTFGTLTNLQNTLGIGSILTFYYEEDPIGTFVAIALQVDTQNQPDLGSKALEVTANGSTYNLSPGSNSTTDLYYTSDGAKQLGDLLKKNVGNTLSFCFRWK